MNLKLITRERRNVVILDASGNLTLGQGTSSLRKRLRELLDGGSRRVLLNMAEVTHIDSAALGELVAAYTIVTAAGGEMKLLNLASRARNLLQITKLYTVFETSEDESSALGSFSAALPTELEVRWTRFFKLIANHSFRGQPDESPDGAGSKSETELRQDFTQLRMRQTGACKA